MAAKKPVERKVKAATLASLAVAVAITALNTVVGDAALLGDAPPWVQNLVTLLAPPLLVFASGYQARHTPQPEQQQQ